MAPRRFVSRTHMRYVTHVIVRRRTLKTTAPLAHMHAHCVPRVTIVLHPRSYSPTLHHAVCPFCGLFIGVHMSGCYEIGADSPCAEAGNPNRIDGERYGWPIGSAAPASCSGAKALSVAR